MNTSPNVLKDMCLADPSALYVFPRLSCARIAPRGVLPLFHRVILLSLEEEDVTVQGNTRRTACYRVPRPVFTQPRAGRTAGEARRATRSSKEKTGEGPRTTRQTAVKILGGKVCQINGASLLPCPDLLGEGSSPPAGRGY